MGESHTYIDVVIGGEDMTFDLTLQPTLSIGRIPQSTVVVLDLGNPSGGDGRGRRLP